jgi:hypothetical protein
LWCSTHALSDIAPAKKFQTKIVFQQTVNQTTNVTGNDPLLTGKIALAHLTEFPDYYTRLAKMEKEAKSFWNSKNTSHHQQLRRP